MSETSELPLIGRERFLVAQLATRLHDEARRHYDHAPLRETPRGNTFEVLLADGRVARVSVVLDHILTTEERNQIADEGLGQR